MYKGEKYIAISFLLVFLLPVAYQPIHFVEHHTSKHDCSSGFCKIAVPGHPVFQKDGHCFICDFEFTVSDLPEEYDTPFVENSLNDLKPAKVQDIFSFEVILHTSPRAPPFSA